MVFPSSLIRTMTLLRVRITYSYYGYKDNQNLKKHKIQMLKPANFAYFETIFADVESQGPVNEP